jgi:succinoglycan biosynthesis transport protein ExoP
VEDNHPYDDEFDLRELIRPLLKKKWWILGVAVVTALLTFLASQYLMGKNYQSTASVVFTQPFLNASLSQAIQVEPQLPDPKTVSDLALADDMLHSIYKTPQLSSQRDQGMTFDKFKKSLDASLSGESRVLLSVTSTDPQLAAQIANDWASAFTLRLNTLYGTSQSTIAALDQQVETAKGEWQQAEQALLNFLPTSQVEALSAQLDQEQTAYNAQLEKIHTIDQILSDAGALDARLSDQAPSSTLSSGDALSLIALQQQATSGDLSGLQVQLSDQGLLTGHSTVVEARAALLQFTKALQAQQIELKAGLVEMETALTQLNTQLESAQYQLEQLTQQRDLAKDAYQALAGQVTSSNITLATGGEIAKLAGTAVPPSKPFSPRVLLNTVAAGAAAFLLAILVVIVWVWWQKGEVQPVRRSK